MISEPKLQKIIFHHMLPPIYRMGGCDRLKSGDIPAATPWVSGTQCRSFLSIPDFFWFSWLVFSMPFFCKIKLSPLWSTDPDLRKAAIPADYWASGRKFSHHSKEWWASTLCFPQEQGLWNSTALYKITFCIKDHHRDVQQWFGIAWRTSRGT